MAAHTHCFFTPGSTHIQDFAKKADNGEWVSYHDGLSKAMMQETHGALLIEFNIVVEIIEKTLRDTLCTGPAVITKECYMEMLEVLPPARWTRAGYSESFHLSEHIDGPFVSWYVRFGEGDFAKYYTLVEHCRAKHSELLGMVCAFDESRKMYVCE